MSSENLGFSLSLDNVKSIPFYKYENNFTFIVNGKRYNTNRAIADLLSPIICKYHYQDETIDEFTINIQEDQQKKDSQSEDYFKDFLNLSNFDKSLIDQNHRERYCQYFLQLGNIHEFLRLQPKFLSDLTPKNCIERLKLIRSLHSDMNEILDLNSDNKIQELFQYIASHFYEISQEEIKTLDIDIIEQIISNRSLKLEEEDSLLQFILEMYENDVKYSKLFEYVVFSNVKEETLKTFVQTFSIDDLNSNIWLSICQRLFSSQKVEDQKERYLTKYIYKEFKHVEGQEFHGIMNFLNEETGGNIHDNGTVSITTNSLNRNSEEPKNLVDYQKDNYYYSKNESKATINFDFKDKKVQLTNYSIKSYDNSTNGYHLKDWVVEVSNDAEHWKNVDERTNESRLNGTKITATFDTKQTDEFYRYVRLYQTGPSWYGNYCMLFYNLEFYGKLMLKSG